MRTPTLLALQLMAVLAACAPRPAARSEPELGPVANGGLRVGEAARIAGTGLRITVESIEDSRCPQDVTCVTAGDARVIVGIAGQGQPRRDTLFVTAAPRSSRLDDRVLTLVDVRPYPRSREPDGRLDRVAVLRVSLAEQR
ncbi:MAG: hypothetical protein JWL60_2471 [Gemmatimonadetes bacterium]|jgi:hypothetical protein|nr:hypothetical protein [Gemmatimonadota bacterium]